MLEATVVRAIILGFWFLVDDGTFGIWACEKWVFVGLTFY